MTNLIVLNTREIKTIRENLLREFGYFPEGDYALIQSKKDDREKIYLVNKDLAKIDWQRLRIEKAGLYFAEAKDTQIRLSKEGAQLLFHEAQKKKALLKNVVELTPEETKQYFRGSDLERDLGPENKLILLTYKNEVLGCARYKEKKVINFMPKIHRGEIIL